MYLSVPLPRALERTVDVVYVGAGRLHKPARHLLVLQQYDQVSKLRQTLLKQLCLEDGSSGQLVLVEVVNHYIARTLDNDQLLLRHLHDDNRTVYALHVPPANASACLATTCVSSAVKLSSASSNVAVAASKLDDQPWKSCSICLEEMADQYLKQHTSCSCLLCQPCIEVITGPLTFRHFNFQ